MAAEAAAAIKGRISWKLTSTAGTIGLRPIVHVVINGSSVGTGKETTFVAPALHMVHAVVIVVPAGGADV